MKDRIIAIINWSKLSTRELEIKTGIDRYTWGKIRNKGQRVNEDHLEAMNSLFPRFSYWLMTGKTIPEAGQVSPESEERRLGLTQGKAG